MTRTLGLIFALSIATASYSYAQNAPATTSPDRGGSESSGTSAKPNPDKKGGTGAATTPKANPKQTPPGTDRPSGESSTQSADPKKNK
jgi:hypothetical protein